MKGAAAPPQPATADGQAALAHLRRRRDSLHFLRVVWVDLCNQVRCKSLSVSWLLSHAASHDDRLRVHVGLTNVCMSVLPWYDTVVTAAHPQPGACPTQTQGRAFSEVFLVPDWATFRELSYVAGVAQVSASFYQAAASEVAGGPALEPWPLCPRHALRAAEARLAAEWGGLVLKGSFEEEFYLLSAETGAALDKTSWCNLRSLDRHAGVLHDLAQRMQEQGFPVEQVLAESGNGQFELTFPYTDIAVACDRHVLFRQTLHSVAQQHGLVATLMSKPAEATARNTGASTGCHGHLSLWRGGESIMPLPHGAGGGDFAGTCGLSEESRHFLAGVLAHIRGLAPLFNASEHSYVRLRPGMWAGGGPVVWGMDNKQAVVRIASRVGCRLRGSDDIEVKVLDHSANIHLAMAALIHAGMDGLARKLPAPPPTSLDPTELPAEWFGKEGPVYYPSSLQESLRCLREDSLLNNSLGPDLVRVFTAMKEAEVVALHDMTEEDRRDLLLQLY